MEKLTVAGILLLVLGISVALCSLDIIIHRENELQEVTHSSTILDTSFQLPYKDILYGSPYKFYDAKSTLHDYETLHIQIEVTGAYLPNTIFLFVFDASKISEKSVKYKADEEDVIHLSVSNYTNNMWLGRPEVMVDPVIYQKREFKGEIDLFLKDGIWVNWKVPNNSTYYIVIDGGWAYMTLEVNVKCWTTWSRLEYVTVTRKSSLLPSYFLYLGISFATLGLVVLVLPILTNRYIKPSDMAVFNLYV